MLTKAMRKLERRPFARWLDQEPLTRKTKAQTTPEPFVVMMLFPSATMVGIATRQMKIGGGAHAANAMKPPSLKCVETVLGSITTSTQGIAVAVKAAIAVPASLADTAAPQQT